MLYCSAPLFVSALVTLTLHFPYLDERGLYRMHNIYKSSYWNGSVTPHITLGRPPFPLPPLPFVSLFNMSVMLGPVPSQDLLPSYSRRQHQQRRRHSAMPGSTRSTDTPEPTTQRQTEHVFELTSPSRACLKIMSSAKTSKSLPTYFEKEVIKGEVEVDLDRGGTVIGVTAMVRLSYLIIEYKLKQ